MTLKSMYVLIEIIIDFRYFDFNELDSFWTISDRQTRWHICRGNYDF